LSKGSFAKLMLALAAALTSRRGWIFCGDGRAPALMLPSASSLLPRLLLDIRLPLARGRGVLTRVFVVGGTHATWRRASDAQGNAGGGGGGGSLRQDHGPCDEISFFWARSRPPSIIFSWPGVACVGNIRPASSFPGWAQDRSWRLIKIRPRARDFHSATRVFRHGPPTMAQASVKLSVFPRSMFCKSNVNGGLSRRGTSVCRASLDVLCVCFGHAGIACCASLSDGLLMAPKSKFSTERPCLNRPRGDQTLMA